MGIAAMSVARHVWGAMRRVTLLLAALSFGPGLASAAPCPDFYRFVDFGITTPEMIVRGGPTFRAEDFEETPLLLREETVCRDARDVAKDGRGNPIPITRSIAYDPSVLPTALEALRLAAVDDIAAVTKGHAETHRTRLAPGEARITRGSDYLCAESPNAAEISCQLRSPFGGNLPLVVYCNAESCVLPGFAVNERVIGSARWRTGGAGNAEAIATESASKLSAIHDFLTPLTSWRADFTGLDR
ncbi:hypothetical protein [Roseivivax halotolerans]|nr:hypothetical protein [Roseivivax halotolerans]